VANVNITKRAIQEAFLAVLNEKSLGKITVKDITDRCGINRNTFYYHYQDIPALLEEICQIQVDELVNKYPELNSVEECLDAAMQIVMDNKRAVMHIYNSDNRNTYVSSLWRMCEATVTTYFNTAFTDDRLSNEDRQLLIRYHKCECFGLILDWINNGLREDYVEGTRRLCQMKKGSVEDMIRRIRQGEGQ
jgi:Transcriptional regulator